jgi:hypothetical protein
MKLICTMPVRNEDWCLGLTARAALMWCDELILWFHACNDNSEDIGQAVAREHPARVIMDGAYDPTWAEMTHRNTMLECARERGATHIAMVDADEILTGNLLDEDAASSPATVFGLASGTKRPSKIRALIELHCERGILNLPWLALARDPMRYISGPSYWGERQNVTTAFKDRPDYHWAARDGYDFHQRPPMSAQPKYFLQPIKAPDGGLMHLQFLSERRLRVKQCLYKLTEVLRWPGRSSVAVLNEMYGHAVYDSNPAARGVTTAAVPAEWWAPYDDLADQFLCLDHTEPWQEAEVKRLLAEHGREKFAGLDLFGL